MMSDIISNIRYCVLSLGSWNDLPEGNSFWHTVYLTLEKNLPCPSFSQDYETWEKIFPVINGDSLKELEHLCNSDHDAENVWFWNDGTWLNWRIYIRKITHKYRLWEIEGGKVNLTKVLCWLLEQEG